MKAIRLGLCVLILTVAACIAEASSSRTFTVPELSLSINATENFVLLLPHEKYDVSGTYFEKATEIVELSQQTLDSSEPSETLTYAVGVDYCDGQLFFLEFKDLGSNEEVVLIWDFDNFSTKIINDISELYANDTMYKSSEVFVTRFNDKYIIVQPAYQSELDDEASYTMASTICNGTQIAIYVSSVYSSEKGRIEYIKKFLDTLSIDHQKRPSSTENIVTAEPEPIEQKTTSTESTVDNLPTKTEESHRSFLSVPVVKEVMGLFQQISPILAAVVAFCLWFFFNLLTSIRISLTKRSRKYVPMTHDETSYQMLKDCEKEARSLFVSIIYIGLAYLFTHVEILSWKLSPLCWGLIGISAFNALACFTQIFMSVAYSIQGKRYQVALYTSFYVFSWIVAFISHAAVALWIWVYMQ